MGVQIILDLRAFSVQECIAALNNGEIVISQHTQQKHFQKILADRLVILLFAGDFLQHDIQICIYFRIRHITLVNHSGGRVKRETVLGGGDGFTGEGQTVYTQYDIIQRGGAQRFLRVLHMGIDDDHVVFAHGKFPSVCHKGAVAVHHIEQFAEGMGVQNALPVPLVFGGGYI